MKIIIGLIIIFSILDLLDMATNNENSKYVRIRNCIFDIVQLSLIGLKLLNYSGLTWLETFIPFYIVAGMIIGATESCFYLLRKSKKSNDKNNK